MISSKFMALFNFSFIFLQISAYLWLVNKKILAHSREGEGSRQENLDMKKHVEELQTHLEVERWVVSEHADRFDHMFKKRAEAVAEAADLKEQLSNRDGQLSTLRAQCDEVKSERDVLHAEVESLAAELGTMKRSSEDLEKKIMWLQSFEYQETLFERARE